MKSLRKKGAWGFEKLGKKTTDGFCDRNRKTGGGRGEMCEAHVMQVLVALLGTGTYLRAAESVGRTGAPACGAT